MAKQTINQGTAPTGAGGDTFRTGSAKLQANDDEIYNYLGDGTNLNKLGTAAFKNTGTQAGNVMGVGAFGLGGNSVSATPAESATKGSGIYNWANAAGDPLGVPSYQMVLNMRWVDGSIAFQLLAGLHNTKDFGFRRWVATNGGTYGNYQTIYSTENTTVDANGFIKKASPIARLFADKIELNDEAKQQEITFEKLGEGDYLIKGSSGFAQNGWYIETPKDANGNLLVAVVYEQLENSDISVKTYDYMLNKKGRIVADTETPLDIPEARWIDLRLQELPQPEIEVTDDPEQ